MSQQTAASLKSSFDRDGYIVIGSFLNPLQLEQVQQRMTAYIRDIVPLLPAGQAMYEDKSRPETIKQLQDLATYDPYFGRLFYSESFVGLAELLLDGPIRAGGFQWFNKPPKIGKATPAHQDGYYFMLKPNEAITMWLALDTVDEENGCMRYIPGSHRKGVRSHARTTTLGFSQGISDYGDADHAAEVAVHAQPGDLLVHHSLTIHRANGNESATRSRPSLGLVYFARRAIEDLEMKNAYHKQLKSELTAAGKL